MIYIKIYLDKDENGEDMLVFDSAKEDGDSHSFFKVACKKHFTFPIEYDLFENMTSVIGVEQVAISAEAKAFFLSLLEDNNFCQKMSYGNDSDFEMHGCCQSRYGWESGDFAFCPPKINAGETRKTLRAGENFTIDWIFSTTPLEYMTPCDNEILKSLDLPADEKPLLDAYYAKMRERGEELGCDEDTIRKTPLRYLTEDQKEVLRAEYRRLASSYDKQEWNESRDYDHAAMLEDKIREAIIKKYGKFIGD
ncbi:MAG: hypothetical protein IJX39_02210 [Clostridia bacterium]|nr:hypothetical protein [Clostridia bacterium]